MGCLLGWVPKVIERAKTAKRAKVFRLSEPEISYIKYRLFCGNTGSSAVFFLVELIFLAASGLSIWERAS